MKNYCNSFLPILLLTSPLYSMENQPRPFKGHLYNIPLLSKHEDRVKVIRFHLQLKHVSADSEDTINKIAEDTKGSSNRRIESIIDLAMQSADNRNSTNMTINYKDAKEALRRITENRKAMQ